MEVQSLLFQVSPFFVPSPRLPLFSAAGTAAGSAGASSRLRARRGAEAARAARRGRARGCRGEQCRCWCRAVPCSPRRPASGRCAPREPRRGRGWGRARAGAARPQQGARVPLCERRPQLRACPRSAFSESRLSL